MKTEEITIKIKPKLKWEVRETIWGSDSWVDWDNNFFIDKTGFSVSFKLIDNNEGDRKIVGNFKTLKTAKAVAELIYKG